MLWPRKVEYDTAKQKAAGWWEAREARIWIHSLAPLRSPVWRCVGGGGIDRYIKETHRVFEAHRAIDGWTWVVPRVAHSACRPCFLQGLFFLLRKKSDMLLRSVKYRLRRREIFACKQAKVKCSLRERWGSFLLRAKNKLIKNFVKYKPRAWTLG